MPESECRHIKAIREQMRLIGIEIYSEQAEDGWVNAYCAQCGRTWEIVMRDDEEAEKQ